MLRDESQSAYKFYYQQAICVDCGGPRSLTSGQRCKRCYDAKCKRNKIARERRWAALEQNQIEHKYSLLLRHVNRSISSVLSKYEAWKNAPKPRWYYLSGYWGVAQDDDIQHVFTHRKDNPWPMLTSFCNKRVVPNILLEQSNTIRVVCGDCLESDFWKQLNIKHDNAAIEKRFSVRYSKEWTSRINESIAPIAAPKKQSKRDIELYCSYCKIHRLSVDDVWGMCIHCTELIAIERRATTYG